ncbi:hypothetical protein LC087_01955 [Bacillus carboniphilus]|uniref:Proline-tRNA ligase class II C-terminal domain-containing protein n=1 Tax=Bacillus carboniphilus TaxID=86663 RepID=A0ABY9JUD9_9BACI|nr:hypothetical protein [Bacillus carboniphilus]WLR43009.1 hypothetical protein LC087_01955 [Bacillus carboniphilus]
MQFLLEEIQKAMFQKEFERLRKNTSTVRTFEEFKEVLQTNPGFIEAMWCGNEQCETSVKEETGATSRCIPFEQKIVTNECIYCKGEASKIVVWAKAY